ncbi:uncharacterized protein LOC110694927 [Chenopodium quinoa]|uniref:uncharacterized protein LOC110694927 n=1 Tax=Chenopodium quinoa TaxID=63459 RepID=UPI000B795710|nr:uncharacterized protein LOC110694927 [Chenopodium quinoa]
MDPLKYLIEKSTLNGRISSWIVNLAQIDVRFMPQKAIKGFVVLEFLADFLIDDSTPVHENDFPDEDLMVTKDDIWTLYFDGASNQKECGVGVLLVSPKEEHVPISIKHDFNVTNKAAEYEACVVGLETALVFGVKKLRIFGDSSLIVNKISKRWKVTSESLAPYQTYLETLIN